jgi:phospholipid/cholesterol/gamma-HCH transport system permease protein
MASITGLLKSLKADKVRWDLSAIDSMDHIGAQLFWNAWGKTRPGDLHLAPGQEEFFNRLETTGNLELPRPRQQRLTWVMKLGFAMLLFFEHLTGFLTLIGQLTLDLWRFVRAPQRGPWKEISANIFHAGFQALGITALVGFLIGVVLSFLSAQQLRAFGGDIYLVNLLGMSVIRELGPLLAAILVAGRSGSSITAQLGVMRVTEELDAMLVMGISHGFRLVMPKVLALAISMPLLVIWTDSMALIGGMLSAHVELNLSPQYFISKLPDAVPLANYMIGLGKGVVFGVLIALVSCHFGLRIKPNTESLGRGTTTSVVTAITVVILADAVFAILFNGVGF